jgi:beta-N-acetylhexosaminidase
MNNPGAGDCLAVGFEGTELPDAVHAMAERAGLGGVVLFKRNCPDLGTVLRLTRAARRLGEDVLVLVDHEGGRVHRLPPPFTRFPAAAAVARVGGPALAARVARAMARELRAAGFDSGLGPVLDCATDPRSRVIGDRAFAIDPDVVAACGAAAVETTLAAGVCPVAKHFPGHGRTPLDSHLVLPEVAASRPSLDAIELPPFRRALAAGCPAVLVAHARYRALDALLPASLSPAVITGLLRHELGFGGLVLSDDLEMEAVATGWGVPAAAVAFRAAGGDLALICRDATRWGAACAALERELEAGRLDPTASRGRRIDLRRRLRAAGPPPDLSVIGCAEHRELAEEIAGRSAPID